jgi:hypothetical protein
MQSSIRNLKKSVGFTLITMEFRRQELLEPGVAMHPEEALDLIRAIFHTITAFLGALIMWSPETLWMQSMKGDCEVKNISVTKTEKGEEE